MVDYKAIGSKLQSQRQKAGLTQETVAEQAGITAIYLSKIENGHVKPTIDLLENLCLAVGTDISFLFLDSSTSSNCYRNETVLRHFNRCRPEVKPVALELLETLTKL